MQKKWGMSARRLKPIGFSHPPYHHRRHTPLLLSVSANGNAGCGVSRTDSTTSRQTKTGPSRLDDPRGAVVADEWLCAAVVVVALHHVLELEGRREAVGDETRPGGTHYCYCHGG